jgi:universal stress protein A
VSKYKHILLATDLSTRSSELAKHALDLAKQWKAKLSAAHVVDYGPMMYGGGEFAIPMDADITATMEAEAKKKLQKQAAKIDVDEKDQWVLHGQTKEEIIHLAKKIKVDLIVVGGHDQRWLTFLFGSTANALLHNMPCDVLTVRLDSAPH